MKTKRKWIKRSLITLGIIFLVMNLVAIFHAYKFTHFDPTISDKKEQPQQLSFGEKVKTLFFGANLPRPVNHKTPLRDYETIRLKSNCEIECWHIKTEQPKGTLILFHGYGGEKSSLLDKSEIFINQGYNTLLVDFMGSGGSEGNQTTIGYQEAEQVKTCFDYLVKEGEKNIYLFGTSMGAVAIMKCINDSKIEPRGIILECPFGTMHQTVCARFNSMNVPTFPMANLLMFWGGIENGFWAFGHNPIDYAKEIECPTLLLYGAKDVKVSRSEIDEIFANLKGEKELIIYPEAGHENYLNKWTEDVSRFLNRDN